jgi:hypothetical protein
MSFRKDLANALAAGYQAIVVNTHEELRALAEIQLVAQHLKMGICSWSVADGLQAHTGGNAVESIKGMEGEDTDSLLTTMRLLSAVLPPDSRHPQRRLLDNTVVILKDAGRLFTDDAFEMSRLLRQSLIESRFSTKDHHARPLILVQPPFPLPAWLQPYVYHTTLPLPDHAATGDLLTEAIAAMDAGAIQPDAQLRSQIIDGCKGMTATEISNAIALLAVKHKGLTPAILEDLEAYRCSSFKSGGVLTLIPRSECGNINDIAGMENLMEFVDHDAAAFMPGAADLKIDHPKGIALLGLPGTAKTTAAKAINQKIRERSGRDLPVIMLNVGALFGSLMGESEERTREALAQIKALGGCVLVLNELDKMFVGVGSGQSGDSGVSERVFGEILNFAEQPDSGAYLVATMNRVDGVPPELLRKGRFDELFFIDTPGPQTRQKIFEIHFHKRGIDPATLNLSQQNWQQIVDETADFSGAEIEALVKRARLAAFNARGVEGGAAPNFDELHTQITATRPLAKIAPAAINKLREFGKSQCREASKTHEKVTLSKLARRTRIDNN